MISDAFFILEGPDGAGKTTLAHDLQKCYNIPSIHLTHYKDPKLHQAQFDRIENLLDIYLAGKATSGLIFDRFIFSTQVYEHIFHNGSGIINYLSIYEKLNAVAKKCPFGATVIFTLPRPKERYLNAFNLLKNTREEMFTDTELMSKVYDGFDTISKELQQMQPAFRVVEFDYFKESDIKNEGGHKWAREIFNSSNE